MQPILSRISLAMAIATHTQTAIKFQFQNTSWPIVGQRNAFCAANASMRCKTEKLICADRSAARTTAAVSAAADDLIQSNKRTNGPCQFHQSR